MHRQKKRQGQAFEICKHVWTTLLWAWKAPIVADAADAPVPPVDDAIAAEPAVDDTIAAEVPVAAEAPVADAIAAEEPVADPIAAELPSTESLAQSFSFIFPVSKWHPALDPVGEVQTLKRRGMMGRVFRGNQTVTKFSVGCSYLVYRNFNVHILFNIHTHTCICISLALALSLSLYIYI